MAQHLELVAVHNDSREEHERSIQEKVWIRKKATDKWWRSGKLIRTQADKTFVEYDYQPVSIFSTA